MDELLKKQTIERAAATAAHSAGMKIVEGSEHSVVSQFESLGVLPSINEHGTFELHQGETQMVLSSAFERVRAASPELFVADPRRDKITSREDLEKGSSQDVRKAKSQWISQHGADAWERLPQTKARAQAVATIPSTEMNREQYLKLSTMDRARLAGLEDGPAIIARIMSRTK